MYNDHDAVANEGFQKLPKAMPKTLHLSREASVLYTTEGAEEHRHFVFSPEGVDTLNRFINKLLSDFVHRGNHESCARKQRIVTGFSVEIE